MSKQNRSSSRGKGRNFWNVKPSSSYFNDCEIGANYADAFIPLLKYNFGVSMLGFIVCDMIRAGEKKSGKGLVVGFIGRVAREFSMTRQSLALCAVACPAFFYREINQRNARSISLKNVNPIKPIQATVTITTEPKSATGQMI